MKKTHAISYVSREGDLTWEKVVEATEELVSAAKNQLGTEIVVDETTSLYSRFNGARHAGNKPAFDEEVELHGTNVGLLVWVYETDEEEEEA